MGLRCGVVGLPNVGKSTLFNALTGARAAAENFPFCTIEPNVGMVPVPDERLHKIAAIVQPQKIIPPVMEFIDIAGLVAGAAQGEGLGNRFLANIREADAMIHVVRCFSASDVISAGSGTPAEDVEIVNTELALADLESAERQREKKKRLAKGGDRDAQSAALLLDKIYAWLASGSPVRTLEMDSAERAIAHHFHFLTAQPVLYLANTDENITSDNSQLSALHEIAAAEQAPMLALCNQLEAELMDLPEEERMEMLSALNLQKPGLERLIAAAYQLLNLQTFFTAGPEEVRAWTLGCGASALEAAACIHTDFARHFIRAEVVSWQDFLKYGGGTGVRDAGKLRLEGKEYTVSDGDLIYFRVSA